MCKELTTQHFHGSTTQYVSRYHKHQRSWPLNYEIV